MGLRVAVSAVIAMAILVPGAGATYGVGHQIYVVDASGDDRRSLSDGVHPDRSLSVSRSGWIAFVRETWTHQRTHDVAGLWVADGDGSDVRRIVPVPSDCTGCIGAPRWSPNGSRLAFVRGAAPGGVWLVDADGSNLRRIAAEAGWSFGDRVPEWLPDGRSLVYHHADPSACGVGEYTNCAEWTVRLVRIRGSTRVLARNARDPRVSPDGRWVAYTRFEGGDSSGLYVVRTDGSVRRAVWPKAGVGDYAWAARGDRLLVSWNGGLHSIRRDGKARRRISAPGWLLTWSPRGGRLAFAYGSGEAPSVWTMRADGRGRRLVARTDGYHPPESLGWSPDGRRIYFTG